MCWKTLQVFSFRHPSNYLKKCRTRVQLQTVFVENRYTFNFFIQLNMKKNYSTVHDLMVYNSKMCALP